MTGRDDAWERRFLAKEIKEAGERYTALAAEYHWWKRREKSVVHRAHAMRPHQPGCSECKRSQIKDVDRNISRRTHVLCLA